MIALAAREFVRKLPKEYVERTREANDLLYGGRKVTIGKTIPRDVVMDTLRKMKIIILGDKLAKLREKGSST